MAINEPWIYEEGKVVDFDGTKILMMPWINPENEADSIELLKELPKQMSVWVILI